MPVGNLELAFPLHTYQTSDQDYLLLMNSTPPHLCNQEEKQTQFSNLFYLEHQIVDKV